MERQIEAARAAGDLPAALLALAGARLLLLQPTEPGASWGVSSVSGQRCLVAFTSASALRAVAGAAPHRDVWFAHLAATWPDPDLVLAIDPGLPVETFLDAATVRDVAALAAQPATELEGRLDRTLRAGDVEAYVAALTGRDVVLPLPVPQPGASAAGSDWARAPGGAVVAFTSARRWQELGGDQPFAQVPFLALVRAWPDDAGGPGLMVDPGLAHGGSIDGAAMAWLRDDLRSRTG